MSNKLRRKQFMGNVPIVDPRVNWMWFQALLEKKNLSAILAILNLV